MFLKYAIKMTEDRLVFQNDLLWNTPRPIILEIIWQIFWSYSLVKQCEDLTLRDRPTIDQLTVFKNWPAITEDKLNT